MSQNLNEIYSKLKALQLEINNLRNDYHGMSKKYIAALEHLKELALHASEAAKRSAKGAEKSKDAAMNAKIATQEASQNPAFWSANETSVKASTSAALSAIEYSGAAAVAAISEHAEES
jgi:DNA anti-recombination protein RmuC